jgi:enamine deaminase RidA (YjgF/YER057c/UK114 family)
MHRLSDSLRAAMKPCNRPNRPNRKILTGVIAVSFALLAGCATSGRDFSVTHSNPDTMVDPSLFGYSQIVTVNNGKMIYLAGQGPTKLNEKSPPPTDLRGQARNAVDNILLGLAAVGAGPGDIVYLRINVVDYNPKLLIDIAPEIARLTPAGAKPPASVFVGVSSLVLPSTRIEIETVAAIP